MNKNMSRNISVQIVMFKTNIDFFRRNLMFADNKYLTRILQEKPVKMMYENFIFNSTQFEKNSFNLSSSSLSTLNFE